MLVVKPPSVFSDLRPKADSQQSPTLRTGAFAYYLDGVAAFRRTLTAQRQSGT
jgi:hypothetical protein